jgi:hypothetical protein
MSFLLGKTASPLIFNTRRFTLDLSSAQVNTLFTVQNALVPATRGYFFIPRATMIVKESGLSYNMGVNTNLGLYWNGGIIAAGTAPTTALGSNVQTKTFINGMCLADNTYRGSITDAQFNFSVQNGSLVFTVDNSNPSGGVGSVHVDALVDIYMNTWPFP